MPSETRVLTARHRRKATPRLLAIALAIFSQLGWGLYPVFSRALQTQSPGLTTLGLIVALNSICALAMACGWLLYRLVAWRWLPPSMPTTKSYGAIRWPRLVTIIGALALVTGLRALTNLWSAGLAPAHWCVMINLCTPIFTASIGHVCFGEALPAGTLPALVGGLIGSALAIFGGTSSAPTGEGNSESEGGDDTTVGAATGWSLSLVLGVSLAFVSAIALAVYQHFVRRTRGLLSEAAILVINYAVMLVPSAAVAAVLELEGSATLCADLGALGARQWAYLLVLALVVYLASNLAQQLAIRMLGPTTLAAVMPLRLLSSVAGSYVVLGEGIASAVEASGLLLVGAAATLYLGYQLRQEWKAPHCVAAAATAASVAAGGGSCMECSVESSISNMNGASDEGLDMRPIEGLPVPATPVAHRSGAARTEQDGSSRTRAPERSGKTGTRRPSAES